MMWEFIGYGLLVVVIIVVLVRVILAIGDEEKRQVQSFEKDFRESVVHSQPEWNEIKEIASTRGIAKNSLYQVIIATKREILAGRDKDLEPHKGIIVSYISKLHEEEPFEGMPDDIKLHLQRIRDKLAGNENILDPLTAKIVELLAVNEKERKRQRSYTIAGTLIGFFGLAFALYAYFSPKIHW
jgi:hypothetical protein